MTTTSPPDLQPELLSVHLVSLGCARNDVDSEELAARLEAGGFRLTSRPEDADAVMVNTCGFVTSAKKDSVDTLLAAADLKDGDGPTRAVVAVGCLAERYGEELAEELPEADAVLSFDDYTDVAARLQSILAGEHHIAHAPRDRRALLPISPTERPAARQAVPGHQHVNHQDESELPDGLAPASGPPTLRRRLSGAPWAPLKLASGCDRRCTFCAIPAFRGSYLSRPPAEVLEEARWLAERGVSEVFLVSENTSSYGKDLGDLRALEKVLPELAAVDGVQRVRVSYLQPAEMRPGLIEVIGGTPGVAAYFDLSFQHASGPLLRRMRRFGHAEAFLQLIGQVRAVAPEAGIRSNVICGFPGETEQDVAVLTEFLSAARLDAIGVFGYSDEDGTEAARLDGQLSEAEIEDRRSSIADLADELVAQRAEERLGATVRVLVESVEDGVTTGRAEHQGPEVDGQVEVLAAAGARVGDWLEARVVGSDGVDLLAQVNPRS